MTKMGAHEPWESLPGLIRAAQGTSRCVYKPGREPVWWPADVPFAPRTKLTPSQIAKAFAAGRADWDNAANGATVDHCCSTVGESETFKPSPSTAKVPKSEEQPRTAVALRADDHVKQPGAAHALRAEESEGQAKPTVAEKAEEAVSFIASPARSKDGNGAGPESGKSSEPDGSADDSGSPRADITDVGVAASKEAKASEESKVGSADGKGAPLFIAPLPEPANSPSSRGEINVRADGDPTPEENDANTKTVEDDEVFVAPLPPRAKGLAVSRKNASATQSKRKDTKTARRQALQLSTGASLKAAQTMPTAKARSLDFPTDEELDAILEDAERIRQTEDEEDIIKLDRYKKRMKALLESCCADIMQKAELVNQRMSKEIREMPADQYVLKYGADPAAVMKHDIMRRWAAHQEDLKGCTRAPDAVQDENTSPAPLPGTLRALANQTATKARRGTAAAAAAAAAENVAATPGAAAVRRSARRRLGVNAYPGTTARLAPLGATERFRRRGGVAKAVASRKPRQSDVLLPDMLYTLTENGSPVDIPREAAFYSDDKVREIEAKLAAKERETEAKLAAKEREIEALKMHVRSTRRKGAAAVVSKLR